MLGINQVAFRTATAGTHKGQQTRPAAHTGAIVSTVFIGRQQLRQTVWFGKLMTSLLCASMVPNLAQFHRSRCDGQHTEVEF